MPRKKSSEVQVENVQNENTHRSELYQMINGFAKSKGINVQDVLDIFSDEINKAINRDIDPEAEIILEIDDANEEIFVYNLNKLVLSDEEYANWETEMKYDSVADVEKMKTIYLVKISDAKKVDPEIEEGDSFKEEINFDNMPKRSKNAIRSGFTQNLRQREKRNIAEKYRHLIGTKLQARVLTKNENNSYNLEFEDGVTAFLPASKVNRSLKMSLGSFIDVYLEGVDEESKYSICIVSTDSPRAIYDLLKNEIPEIEQGLIVIKDVRRKPGERTKVSVEAAQSSAIDPVTAIIGVNGKRILEVSNKLGGEKIDVIRYSDDLASYVKYAMSPAKVVDVVPINKGSSKYPNFCVIVKKGDLTTAIGKRGINVELARDLTKTWLELLTPEEAVAKGIEFKNEQIYDKPLFKPKHTPKRTPAQSLFEELDIDVTDFASDVSRFIEEQTNNEQIEEEPVQKEEKKATKSAEKSKKSAKLDIDSLFDIEDVSEQIESDNNYDFLNKIDFDKVFDDSEIEEDEISEKPKSKASNKEKESKAYNKAKIELKDFKVDNDLVSYGLSENLDLSDFDDEWEK
ncbi:transcription termination/antitermination protein NusA [Mycoplasmopsis pullorum]|uniref:NusA N-terminal domain-containing protein n=1 Tax=Mycoplasmopsis pullorum TaxID=48003 RepID=UPI0011180470|nr:NusA N-terminal domain-containing protein [Mycoplasmopsis pullorum]TNK83622.1 transcription termination/antitermination protein NusA [Mycoplasmopsis pullorum]TNK91966.1 transcription termination/antitermination protein NusA [Mycoplasmopsis pullorum]